MSELTTDHYRMLLGLDEDWSVDAVTFDPSGRSHQKSSQDAQRSSRWLTQLFQASSSGALAIRPTSGDIDY